MIFPLENISIWFCKVISPFPMSHRLKMAPEYSSCLKMSPSSKAHWLWNIVFHRARVFIQKLLWIQQNYFLKWSIVIFQKFAACIDSKSEHVVLLNIRYINVLCVYLMYIYATIIIKEEVINLQKSREGHMEGSRQGRKWYKYSTHIRNSLKETYLIKNIHSSH